jgi:hypothetical protein
MILCENPWYNEPGRERQEDKTESDQYNARARQWTLQYAIRPWVLKLHANEQPDRKVTGLWADVVHFHLSHHAAAIHQSHTAAAHWYRGDARLATAVRDVNEALKLKGFLK